ETILSALRNMNFAGIEEQGFMPLYKRTEITDALHAISPFRTDFQFITKSKMKTIQKLSKGRK
ncbi:MAG: transposase, partial [Eubacteriales bacterium]|nr:transposase [Eubacteriales bacterium]